MESQKTNVKTNEKTKKELNVMNFQGKNITVFNMRMAGYLQLKGFILIGVSVNRNDPTKFVYFFKNSYIIQQEMMFYKNEMITV